MMRAGFAAAALTAALCFFSGTAEAQSVDVLSRQFPAPSCAPDPQVSGPRFPGSVSRWPSNALNNFVRDYFNRVETQPLNGAAMLTPTDAAGAEQLRTILAQVLTGDPNFTSRAAQQEFRILRPYASTQLCPTVWMGHIVFLVANRALLPLAEQRVLEMREALSADGELSAFDTAVIQNALGALRAAEGKHRQAHALMRAGFEQQPGWQQLLLRSLGFERMMRQGEAIYTGYDRDGVMGEAGMAFGAYDSTRAHDCNSYDQTFGPIFTANAEYRRAFPAFAVRAETCAARLSLFGGGGMNIAVSRRRLPQAGQALEQIADQLGEVPGYRGWRQAAIYDQAFAVADYLGDVAATQRLAGKAAASLAGRPANADPLRSGELVFDSTIWRGRLVRLRGQARSDPTNQTTLNEILAIGETMPRASADQALRNMALQSSADARTRTAFDRYRRAQDTHLAAQARLQYAAHADVSAANAAAQQALAARDNARTALRAASPLLAGQVAALPAPTIAELRATLRQGEALVVMHNFPVLGGMALVVRQDGARMIELPMARGEVITQVAALRRAASVNPGARPTFDARPSWALYQGLIAPLTPHLEGVTHLIIVPDSASSDLPWGALVTADPGRRGRMNAEALASAPFLLDRFGVAVIPSASTFVALRRSPPARREASLLGVGAPTFSSGGGEGLRYLAGLPAIGRDGLDALAAAIGDERSLILGAEATEPAVRAALARSASVVVFGTHGLFAGAGPGVEEPALVVSYQGGAQGPGNDGLLTASEIAALRMNADLVLLLACDTASSGGELDAETLSGLVRGFYAAGARNVVATYWAANDAFAAQMAEPLSAYLADRAPVSTAVRESLNAMRRTAGGRFSHPYYWASFGVFGVD